MHTNADARLSHDHLATGLGWFSLALGTAELAAPRAVARLIGIPDDPRLLSVLRAFGAREIASGAGLLSQAGRAGWAWSRVGGDAIDLAKIGAVLTAFLFPVLLVSAGTDFLLMVLVATSLLGAWITWQFRIETTGVNLEEIGR